MKFLGQYSKTNLSLHLTLREAATEAAMSKAHIILFPEDGIHGYGFNRETLPPFLEELSPVGSNPCFEDTATDATYVQVL